MKSQARYAPFRAFTAALDVIVFCAVRKNKIVDMGAISSDIFAFSFDGLSSPSISLKFRQGPQQGDHTLGWGLGWFPGDSRAAIVAKDPAANDTGSLEGAMKGWDSFRSTVFFCKVRGAATGYTHLETQPFSRSFAGQDWIFMHNGDLDKPALEKLHNNRSIFLEPLGRTDSELAFCFLLGRIQDYGARSLADVEQAVLLSWFLQLDDLGSSDMVISDGISVVAFRGSQSETELYMGRIKPPHGTQRYEAPSASFAVLNPRDTFRTCMVIASTPFKSGVWTPLKAQQMVILRRGEDVTKRKPNVEKAQGKPSPLTNRPRHLSDVPQGGRPFADQQFQAQQLARPEAANASRHISLNLRSITHTPDGLPLGFRVYDIEHTTTYDYARPVEHSTHVFRLGPIEDHAQEVLSSSLEISVPGQDVRFEDVFGNLNLYYSIIEPYKRLSLISRSRVKVFGQAPDDLSPDVRNLFLPLVMMPWQRQMMEPFLLPPELPETQLSELMIYAMSFVERNSRHVMDTLRDINQTLYRDFRYVPGVTSVNTTPFEVYANRAGVCQDFANLFITLVRLLGIPARYRMGYIYTGGKYENTLQSDASHAWAEIYIPYLGWRGFDPTNGCLVGQDHVRVAAGRNYLDATPTTGTIYRGGGNETLNVQVKINEVIL